MRRWPPANSPAGPRRTTGIEAAGGRAKRRPGAAVALLGNGGLACGRLSTTTVLALFTSYDRAGQVDFELFEESLRRARELARAALLVGRAQQLCARTAEQSAAGLPKAFSSSARWSPYSRRGGDRVRRHPRHDRVDATRRR